MKLLLFDLDGTILHARHTPGRVPFDLAMRDVFGVDVSITRMRPDGKTDPAIVAELLAMAGRPPEVDAASLVRLEKALAEHLDAAIASGATRVDAVPGVRELLAAVADDARFASAVLTGNLAEAARLKLAAAELDGFFDVGAYGSDHVLRAALPDVARDRFRARSGRFVAREDCVIIGDTPLDHAAAEANGMPAVLIATGRIAFAELAALAPAAVFADWSDAIAIHAALAALAERKEIA